MTLKELNDLEQEALRIERDATKLKERLDWLAQERRSWQELKRGPVISLNLGLDTRYHWAEERASGIAVFLQPIVDAIAPDLMRAAELQMESTIRATKAQAAAIRARLRAHIVDSVELVEEQP